MEYYSNLKHFSNKYRWWSNTKTDVVTSLSIPAGIKFDVNNWLICENSGDKVSSYNITSGTLSTIVSGIDKASDLTIVNTDIYITSRKSKQVGFGRFYKLVNVALGINQNTLTTIKITPNLAENYLWFTT